MLLITNRTSYTQRNLSEVLELTLSDLDMSNIWLAIDIALISSFTQWLSLMKFCNILTPPIVCVEGLFAIRGDVLLFIILLVCYLFIYLLFIYFCFLVCITVTLID